jgi:hypothetical protein
MPLQVIINPAMGTRAHSVCACFVDLYTKRPTICDLCTNKTHGAVKCTYPNCPCYVHPWCAASLVEGKARISVVSNAVFREVYCAAHSIPQLTCTPLDVVSLLCDAAVLTEGTVGSNALRGSLEERVCQYFASDADKRFFSLRDCFAEIEQVLFETIGYRYTPDSYLHTVLENAIRQAYNASGGFSDITEALSVRGVPMNLIPTPLPAVDFLLAPLPRDDPPPYIIDTLKSPEICQQLFDTFEPVAPPEPVPTPEHALAPEPVPTPEHALAPEPVKSEAEIARTPIPCFWYGCASLIPLDNAIRRFEFEDVVLDEYLCAEHAHLTLNPVAHGISATTVDEIAELLHTAELEPMARNAIMSFLGVLGYI